MNRRLRILLLCALVPLAGACVEDESLVLPERSDEAVLFSRYAAMGNSITAGFMSGGINDSTQHLAYPVLLADRANTDFGVPSLAMPGCPPPLVSTLDTIAPGTPEMQIVIETDRVGGGTASTCAGLAIPGPDVVQNLAVPGATIADAVLPPGQGPNESVLTTLILGGQSQVDAMQRIEPTLVSVWLGNNDVLGAAVAGEPALMTPVDTFAHYAERIGRAVGAANPIDAVFIGVVRPRYAPVLQPGLYYWVADSLGLLPKPVADDCAPTLDGAGNDRSMNTVSFQVLADAGVGTISCADDAPYVLTPQEMASVDARVDAYNDAIQEAAGFGNWLYVDPNRLLENAADGIDGAQRLRQCRGLDNTDSLDDIVQTVAEQCPFPSAPNFWGSLISYDGVHPSAAAHELVADEIAAELNSRHDLTL